MAQSSSKTGLRQRFEAVGPLTWSITEAGDPRNPAMLLLHGWPQSARAFDAVMPHLAEQFHVLAADLPQIGGSRGSPASGAKSTLATAVHDLVGALGLSRPMLVGHDVGGQIAFAYLRAYGRELSAAAIVSVAVPGLSPWSEVVRNPRIWHFAFHSVPKLPELLVTHHIGAYFDFFYDAIAARPEAITPAARAAYASAYERPDALSAGFEWYRAFPRDETDNGGVVHVETPVLYLRGDHEPGELADYAQGLRASGLNRLETGTIPHAGHFIPEENPEALADQLRRFRLSVAAT
jgi:pimeloyl-ACP methyl ester carboxylesterase